MKVFCQANCGVMIDENLEDIKKAPSSILGVPFLLKPIQGHGIRVIPFRYRQPIPWDLVKVF